MSLFKRRINRFLMVGVFNTINGYIWILGLQLLTAKPLISNLLGYIVAAIIGYLIHARFTFEQKISLRNAMGYSLVISCSYFANLLVLKYSLTIVPPMVAQTFAVSIFILLSYLGQSKFAFA